MITANKQRWLGLVLGSAALLAIFAWLFWDFLYKQIRFAIEQQSDWGHTLVIPFIAAYFVYRSRDRLLASPLKTTWSGLAPMMLGVAAYLVCTMGPVTLRHHNLQGAGVALTITGITLLFCGWRAMRWLWFPLLFLFVFGQTVSERLLNLVTFKMQDITARGSAIVLSMFLDVDRLGNTIYVYHNGQSLPLNIAEACSGMRMLMAFLALGVVMACTGLRHPWQRVLLVLMAVPTAIIVNVLRVCTLGVLGIIDPGFAAGDFHSFIGLVWLLPAFLIYLGLMWIIRNLVIDSQAPVAVRRTSSPTAEPRIFDHRAKIALLVCCGTLLICSLGFRYAVAALNIYLRKEPVALRETFATLPRIVGQWRAQGDDLTYDEAMLEALGTRDTLSRMYALQGEPSRGVLAVHLAYYTGMIDAVPHVPDRCFVAAGLEQQSLAARFPLKIDASNWVIDTGPANIATGQPYRRVQHRDMVTGEVQPVRMPVGEMAIRLTEFARKDEPGLRVFGGFFFVANGRVTATPEDIRLLAFKPSERYAYYCKVQIVYAAPGASGGARDQYLNMVSDFLNDFLPELMLRLPDWQEVERRQTKQGSGARELGISGLIPNP